MRCAVTALKTATLAVAAAIVVVNGWATTSSAGHVVDLEYAKYRGFLDLNGNVTRYLGIRYAAPPVGNLRWRAPRPPSPSQAEQIYDANSFGARCIQSPIGLGTTNPLKDNYKDLPLDRRPLELDENDQSEDCLYLNVFVPSSTTSGSNSASPLPVVVWIHGGGYVLGGADLYDGAALIHHADNGIIVVSIQYRLGIFGFLPGQEVKKHGVLNAGLLDQEFALKWVQEHIGKFGGDPSQVTIWGQSAGGGSVLQHLLAHDGKTMPPLFQRAILSSVYLPSQYEYDDTSMESLYTEVLKRTDCSSAADTLACLRSTDVSVLASASADLATVGFKGSFLFTPVIDGEFSTQSPVKALKEKKVNPVTALLSMINVDEGSMFVDAKSTLNTSEYILESFHRIVRDIADKGAALYKDLGSISEQRNAVFSDALFVCPHYYTLRAYETISFAGRFAILPGTHCQEMPYYFTGLKLDVPLPPLLQDTAFVQAFARSFLSIARFSDPNIPSVYPETIMFQVDNPDMMAIPNAQKTFNPNMTVTNESLNGILPKWSVYSPGNIEMLFGKKGENEPDIRAIETDASLLERCSFWESIQTLTSQ